MCGFSARTVAALDALGRQYAAVDVLPDPRIRQELSAISELADDPAAVRQGRAGRRLRHRQRDVRVRRAGADAGRRAARRGAGASARGGRARRAAADAGEPARLARSPAGRALGQAERARYRERQSRCRNRLEASAGRCCADTVQGASVGEAPVEHDPLILRGRWAGHGGLRSSCDGRPRCRLHPWCFERGDPPRPAEVFAIGHMLSQRSRRLNVVSAAAPTRPR